MKTLHLAVWILGLWTLSGCSTVESRRVDYKSGTTQVQALDVPPDLTTPAAGDRYIVPEDGGEVVAVYSDYSRGGSAAQVVSASNVLPEIKSVRLERNGSQRWLVMADRAENVWPLVKAFWQDNGFIVQSEHPEAGLMETDWRENRAKIPQGKVRSVIGIVFDKVYSSDEKDMYQTRLERSKDGVNTEIYISHRGMEEVQNADKKGYTWRSRGHDPEMEASMLQLLMVKLGGSSIEPAAAESQPSSTPDTVALQETAEGGKRIVLSEPFDKSWRKVGLALEQTGIAVGDLDRANGIYFVNAPNKIEQKKSLLERLKFWRADKNIEPGDSSKPGDNSKPGESSARYQVTVVENNSVCEVNVLKVEGGRDETSQLILESLYKQLVK